MKVKEIPSLEQKVLGMLPITQAEVWKSLGIGNRNGSTLITIMVDEGLIKRTKFNKTFLLEKRGEKDNKQPKTFTSLLSNGKFSPCCGCSINCKPSDCKLLEKWLKSN